MLTRLESARSRVLLESMEESRLEIILVRAMGVFFLSNTILQKESLPKVLP